MLEWGEKPAWTLELCEVTMDGTDCGTMAFHPGYAFAETYPWQILHKEKVAMVLPAWLATFAKKWRGDVA